MREILFRAKLNYDDKWVYGLPTKIHPNGHCSFEYKINETEYCYDCSVRGETLSQFTGLFDKNGNNIFEGDLLRDDYTDDDGTIVPCPKQVFYCTQTGCFGIDISFEQDGRNIETIREYFGEDPLEVVGNIYDDTSK